MGELLYSIRDIFTKYLFTNGKIYYNIPAYQRGYKWDSTNVRQLLDDLLSFQDNNLNTNNYYCLQNITIIPGHDRKGTISFQVADGQQRLTTLYILISYYNYKGEKWINETFDIDTRLNYEVRDTTGNFLNHCVSKGTLWNLIEEKQNIASLCDSKDKYYICEVAKTIVAWYKEHDQNKNQPAINVSTILDRVQLIVNSLHPGDEENVFAGLNGGKVDLDGADLMRAILITRSAKEKFPKFATSQEQFYKQCVQEYRIQMGQELDSMNQFWGNKNIQFFYDQLLPDNTRKNKTFNYGTYPIGLLYTLLFEADKDKFAPKDESLTIRLFEYGLDIDGTKGNDHWELYDHIIKLHHTLKDWHEDDEIYHLLGYLFFNYKGQACDSNNIHVNFHDLWNKIWNISSTKNEFKDKLKNLIRNLILNNYLESDNRNIWDCSQDFLPAIKLKDTLCNINEDWYTRSFTSTLLPLLDVIICSNKDKRNGRLDSKYFKVTKEDKEHIRPRTPHKKDEDSTLVKKDWIEFINNNFDDKDNLKQILLDELKELNDHEPIQESLQANLLKRMNNYGLNSIGNIVLLHESINRSYGNAGYREKLQRITNEFFTKKYYVRPYTFHVFLSKITNQNKIVWHWTSKEIEDNAANIWNMISQYLKIEINS